MQTTIVIVTSGLELSLISLRGGIIHERIKNLQKNYQIN